MLLTSNPTIEKFPIESSELISASNSWTELSPIQTTLFLLTLELNWDRWLDNCYCHSIRPDLFSFYFLFVAYKLIEH